MKRPSFELELELFRNGKKLILGIDEAGRGALAGPLAVSGVIFDPSHFSSSELYTSINDSKKMTENAREAAFKLIKEHAVISETVLIDHSTVDALNVNGATRHAIDELLKRIAKRPDILLIDGNFRFRFPVESRSVKKGDSISLSIAAAGILSKVTRDRIMASLPERYSCYAFDQHKGYGTKLHMERLAAHGPSDIHRMTYAPVAAAGQPDED